MGARREGLSLNVRCSGKRTISNLVAAITVGGSICAAVSTTVYAQPAVSPAPATLDAAFARMVARPNDPAAALDYAKLAAAQGQPRIAIAALERVLRANPSLDQIRLELASLYLAAGSPDLAAVYAQQALQSPAIPPDVSGRAGALLAQAEQGSARSVVRISLFTGLRHDSDATQATSLEGVSVFSPVLGTSVTVAPGIRSQSDWSAVLNASISHTYDLGLQTPASWETNASLYGQRFFSIARNYDLLVGQADTGPRIGWGEVAGAQISVRPYVTATWLGFRANTYAWLYGGGLQAQARTDRWNASVTAQGRFGDYEDSTFRPLSRPYTGPEYSVTVAGQYALTSTLTLAASATYYDASGRLDAFSRRGPGATISATRSLPLPLPFPALQERPAELSVRAGMQRLDYGGPLAFIDPTRTRRDTQVEAGITLNVPTWKRLDTVLQYSYFRNDSSYNVYAFDDHSFTIGVRAGF